MSFSKEKAKYGRRLSRGGSNRKYEDLVYDPYKKKIIKKQKLKKKYSRTEQSKIIKMQPLREDKNWFGDTLTQKPNKNTTRFMLLNCNGISRSRDTNWFKSQLTRIIQKDVHYMALVESNVNPYNAQLRQRLLQAYSEIIPDGILNLTNTL